MTKVLTGAPEALISWSGLADSLAASSSATPKKPRPAAARHRTGAECSPIPAVNTRMSRPPRAATIEAMPARNRCRYTPIARTASWSPVCSAASTARMSALPARPSSPERCNRAVLISLDDRPPWSSSQSTSPASTDPARVAMTSPSSGVKPIVVSTQNPPRTAARDAPAPRWHVTTRRAPPSVIAAARRDA